MPKKSDVTRYLKREQRASGGLTGYANGDDSGDAQAAREAAAIRMIRSVRLRASGGRIISSNINHNPTEKEAGNYAKDHVKIHGLDIAIENAHGKLRKGVDKDGKPWSVRMPAHYGYIKGTTGKDKDHVDVYVGPNPKSPKVWVLDQLDHLTGKFDEHKCFLGFATKAQVIATYRRAFSDGKADQRLGHLKEMSIADVKDWLDNGNTKKPIEEHAA